MKYMNKIIAVLLMLIISGSAFAQFDIITAKELKGMLDNDDIIIVSTRKAEDYAKVHIKNAINVELTSLYREGPIEGHIKTPEELAKVLGEKGVDPAKTIIIYDNGKYVYATYLYFILDYLGYPDVKILDGHMTGWRSVRGPVTKTPFSKPAVTVTPKINQTILVDYDYVKGKLDNAGTLIVDVQSAKEFDEGHIPGAINMENKTFFDEVKSELKPKEELEKVLAEHKITADKEIILYCASSARAGTVYLAMKEMGYDNLKVYEAGYHEWKTK
jgi:thiosulfate/3-mercaptopyruvate sulfurtransferase